MARSHMRWQFGAWDKPDHAETGKDARHLYMTISADETVNQAGVLTMRPGAWARDAAMTPDEVQVALDELEQRRFVVTDPTTGQLLIRTFIRNDEVAAQPNVLRSALSYAATLRSVPIRRVLAQELRKLPPKPPDKPLKNGRVFVYPDPHAAADDIDPDGPGGVSSTPPATPPPDPSEEGSANPSEEGSRTDAGTPQGGLFAEPFREPPVVVVGVVEGEVTSGGTHQTAPTELARRRDDPPSPAVPLTINKRAQRLAKLYYDTHGRLTKFEAVLALAKAAIQDDWPDGHIEAALLRLHDKNLTPSKGSLDRELRGPARTSNKPSASDRARRTLALMEPDDERGHVS